MSAIVKSSGKETGRLKLNVTNIKSTLLKGSKTTANLANIKEKSIFKKKEAEKIRAEESALELKKPPKKKITKESSPLKGGSMLDKLIEAGVFLLIGFYANVYGEIGKFVIKYWDPIKKFVVGLYDGVKGLFDFIGGGGEVDQGKFEGDKAAVQSDLDATQSDTEQMSAEADENTTEIEAIKNESEQLDAAELDNLTIDSGDEEEGEKTEKLPEADDSEIEGKVDDASQLGPVKEGSETTEETTDETKDAVVESMKKDPEVQKLAEGGKSEQGAANATTNIKDSIPTLLSPGEYVLKAKIAKAIGYDVLDGVNGIGPSSGTQEKFKEISMLNKGKKKGKTVIVKQTQVVQTPIPV